MRYTAYDDFFKPIVMDEEMMKTMHYGKVLHDFEGDLGGSPTEPCFTPEDIIDADAEDQVKDLARYGHESINVFADYETYCKSDSYHQDYVVGATDGDGLRKHWKGGYKMLFNIGEYYMDKFGPLPKHKQKNTHYPVNLLMHNSTYDWRFLTKHLAHERVCQKGHGLIVCWAKFYMGKGQWYPVCIKNTYKLIPEPLSKLPAMFGLSCEKEVMAYDMYTKENLERRHLPMKECVKYVKAEHQDVKQFQDNCKRWKVVDRKKMVDIYEYSATYCLVDCDVLCQAFAAFDKLMHEVCVYDGGSLRLNKYYTLQSMVDEFLHVKDCYTGVVQLSGVTRAFVQESYVGGRVMMANNEMQRVLDKKIADYDGVSLFPSAMA
jgi:hypothetical protein